MAFLNGIFSKQPQQVNQQQGQPQGNQQNQQQPQQQNQPTNGNGSGGPAGSQSGVQNSNYQPGGNASNPLDPFVQLMTPSREVIDQRTQQQQQQGQGLFGEQFNADNINKAVGGMNFSADPELAQKALGGDSQALNQMLSQVMQQAVSTAMQASHAMVEHGVKTGNDRFNSSLDSRFRDLQLRGQTSQHQALQHPIGKSMLSTFAKQIAEANPRMAPQEVHAKAEEALITWADQLTSGKQQQGQEGNQKSQGTDWAQYLDSMNQ